MLPWNSRTATTQPYASPPEYPRLTHVSVLDVSEIWERANLDVLRGL